MRILVVEDEKDLRESLCEGLRLSGWAVDSCADGEEADELVYAENYDLIILDLNLPKMDGITVLHNLREYNKEVNVLILSARSALADKIEGLDCGANDYMIKPFHFEELQARVRSLLRRKTFIENTVLKYGALCLNTASREVHIYDKLINLTFKETAILEYLLLHKGRVISIDELLQHVWDSEADSFTNSVRVHISSLRRKVSIALGKDIINNVIGEGYIIKENLQ
ncbi:MAG: response regulator transcription factor [Oscillospiraceae bacterium]